MLGSNLMTDHLFPLSVNLGKVRRLYNSNRLVELKTLIYKNRGGVSARRKMQKVIMSASGENGQSMDIDTGISWESCEGMREVMEGVLSLVALEHTIRPHSYQGRGWRPLSMKFSPEMRKVQSSCTRGAKRSGRMCGNTPWPTSQRDMRELMCTPKHSD